MTRARIEEHVGELKLTLTTRSLEELFGEAAAVVARACGTTGAEASDWRRVSLSAADLATLLADWINDLIGRSEIDGVAYDEVRFAHLGEDDDGARLDAEIRGRRVRVWRSSLKAATYHGLGLDRTGDRFRATVLLDV